MSSIIAVIVASLLSVGVLSPGTGVTSLSEDSFSDSKVIETTDVPYQTREIIDDGLPKGVRVTVSEGTVGKKVTLQKMYEGLNNVPITYSKIVKQPTDEVVRVGSSDEVISGVDSRVLTWEEEKAAEEKAAEVASSSTETAASRSTATRGCEVNSEGYVMPLDAGVYTKTSEYGWRFHPIFGVYRLHSGVDWAASEGTNVYAAAAGTVTEVSYDSGGGNYITIQHSNNIQTRYLHLNSSYTVVKVGDKVNAGQHIAGVGSTGNSTGAHLHFEVLVNGETVNPEEFMSGTC